MALLFVAVMVMACSCFFIQRASIPRVDDALATEVILGDDPDLPLVFAYHSGVHSSAADIVAAIREAKRNGASGIQLNITTTREGVTVLFCDSTPKSIWYGDKEDGVHSHAPQLADKDAYGEQQILPKGEQQGELGWTLQKGVTECLRLGLRLMLHVEDVDLRALVAIHDVFTEWPELHRRALVVSPSTWFLYLLRRQNPRIVTALSWQPFSLAYKDTEYLQARFQSLPAHWLAKSVDSLLDWALREGLLLQVTGASAILVSRNLLSPEYVARCRAEGLQVIASAPNNPVEKDFFRKVLKVPIITDVMRKD